MRPIISEEARALVLSEITPTEEEIKSQTSVIAALRESLEKQGGFPHQAIDPQGSTGRKQTQLRGASDIDLFVILSQEDYPEILALDRKERSEAIDKLMDNMVEEWFMPALRNLQVDAMQKTYSQHPYLSLEVEGFDIDIVSCFYVHPDDLSNTGPITAVDRTIHHTDYVTQHIDGFRDDVRILKSFVRANHAYADRCAVGRMGFTGYALELLVILKLGIDEAIRGIMELDSNPLDPFPRKIEELRKRPAFRDDYIFVMDPTDPWRNVASSFDKRAYSLLKLKARELIELSESKNDASIVDLLIEKPIPTTPVPDWFEHHCVVREFKADGMVHYTVLRDKLYRLGTRIANELMAESTGETRFGRALTELYFEGANYALGFLIEKPIISDQYERKGPPEDFKEATAGFRTSHPDAFERGGHLWANVPRKWSSAEDLISEHLKISTIEGLVVTEKGQTTKRLLNIMKDFVLPAEPTFPSLK